MAQLWRHPVKSLQGERLDSSIVGSRGLVGDRAWGVRDEASGALLSAKREPRLLFAAAAAVGEGVLVALPGADPVSGARADEALSSLLGRRVSVVPAPAEGPAFVDEADLHLLTSSQLSAGDVRRFRPNIVLDTPLDLDELIGARLTIGAITVEVTTRTRRCAMTTAAQPGLPKDVSVLRSLARDGGLCHGVYARVTGTGGLRVGDSIRVT